MRTASQRWKRSVWPALGKKGEISAQMAMLGKMEPDARKAAGAMLNVLKDEIDAALRAKKAAWRRRP